jgi:hypothetical protein
VVVIAVALIVLLIVGILLAPLGAGIVLVATLIVVAIVGLAVWGLFFARSRSGSRQVVESGGRLDTPELLGPGGPDDPDRDAPPAPEAEHVDTGARS